MNTDFDIFSQILLEESEKKIENIEVNKILNQECTHEDTFLERGSLVCGGCGESISKKIECNKEWRWYGSGDSKHSSDPNRVQKRKEEFRTIHVDVKGMGFSDKIIRGANDIYMETTKGLIYRGDSRKSIIFGCFFHAFKLTGKPQNQEKLISVIGITKKCALRGLKFINLNAPKNSPIRTSYITPVNFISDIMDRFDATKRQHKEVKALYKKIKNKSSILNRSRPQSVAAGLIYFLD